MAIERARHLTRGRRRSPAPRPRSRPAWCGPTFFWSHVDEREGEGEDEREREREDEREREGEREGGRLWGARGRATMGSARAGDYGERFSFAHTRRCREGAPAFCLGRTSRASGLDAFFGFGR